MPGNEISGLNGVSETLLITLYLRALESQRPDALIHDEAAVALVQKISQRGWYDFARMRSLHLSEENRLVIILRSRELDRYTRDFLARHPDAVVVHIGCGFDTRFERVGNGQAEWYDLDLPEVIKLRREMMGEAGQQYHLLGCSVLDADWLAEVSVHRPRPFVFIAEGVFMYLSAEQVKQLVQTLCRRFPGAELAFDTYSPIHVWRHNLQMSGAMIHFPARWGIWHGQELEQWDPAIHLLGEWGYFDTGEPRLAPIRWMRWIEMLARTFRIYYFRFDQKDEGNGSAGPK